MIYGIYIHYFLDFRPEEYDLKRVDVEVFENVTTRNNKRYSFIDVRAYFYSMINHLCGKYILFAYKKILLPKYFILGGN